MGYTALYRKFRPDTFADVKGQDAIVQTLKNQINADRIGHAYLFCGTRGTGKTTVAKILAKAVNCEHPIDGNPCNECATCKAIAAGSSMNVIEIDAASNNGVDNIREIREETTYSPTEGKYKVYIIDEVHMLSQGAFNALLKTLEEPPSYVIFILATTEIQKVPITIISRCQRYDFHRISIETIAGRMRELMDQEKVDIDDKALRYIAKCADGSMRDGLSILDECIAFYMDRHISYDDVLKILGAVDNEIFQTLLVQILKKETVNAILTIEGVVNEGRELTQFVNDFVWYLRNLLLAKSMDKAEDLLEMSSENFEALKELAAKIDDHILMRYIRILSDLSNEMKFSSQKRILLEVAVIRMCRPEMEEDLDSLIERIDDLEKQVEEGVVFTPAEPGSEAGAKADRPKAQKSVKKQMIPDATPEEVRRLSGKWKGMVSRISDGFLKTIMTALFPTVSPDGKLELVADSTDQENGGSIAASWLFDDEMKEEHRKIIQTLINDAADAQVEIVYEVNNSGRDNSDLHEDLISKFGSEHDLDIHVEIDQPEEGGNKNV